MKHAPLCFINKEFIACTDYLSPGEILDFLSFSHRIKQLQMKSDLKKGIISQGPLYVYVSCWYNHVISFYSLNH